MVNKSLSSVFECRMSSVVCCWNNRYQCVPILPTFLKTFENCRCSGWEPNPSKLQKVSQFQRIQRVILHVVVVQLEQVWDLGKSLPQMRLVPSARVVMEIGMRDLFVMSSRPMCVFAVVPAFDCQPFLLLSASSTLWHLAFGVANLQYRQFFPHTVCVNLIAASYLCMETATVYMFLHQVLPHESMPT